MSLIRCERCEDIIDTDKDSEAEVYIGNYRKLDMYIWACASCREKMVDEKNRKQDNGDNIYV